MSSKILRSYSSSNTLLKSKTEWNQDTETHFRWQSIRNFISIATTMSSAAFNFDLFSRITTKVRIFDFIVLESTVGISYLFMDSFLKLYTKRYDCNRYLNPLLKGISYGHLIQTSYFTLVHGTFMADTMRYLAGVFREVPSWATCNNEVNKTCISMKDVVIQCAQNRTTSFQHTSVFSYYKNYFTYGGDKNTVTSRLFVTAIAWILSFLLSSVTDETIVKIFNLTNAFTLSTTIVTIGFLLYAKNADAAAALSDIFDGTTETSWILSMRHVAYSYGIGFLGIYDYGTISPYVMVDTASLLFMVSFTLLSLMRSWIIKTLYLGMIKCVVIDETFVITTHNLFYAVLPSTTEFFYVKKLFLLFILGNLAVTLMSFETFLISTISKFLRYQFQHVKQIYIVGMVCVAGFGITVTFIGISVVSGKRPHVAAMEAGGMIGLDIIVLYLSAFRVAIVMWLYGVKMFATDIHFWLGFHPTKYWSYNWGLLPFVLIGFWINNVFLLVHPLSTQIMDFIYLIIVFLIVSIFQLKTIASYLINNNIIGAFMPSKLHGPPEVEDRKRRVLYNEVTQQRKCIHNCFLIDEWFDCNHIRLTESEESSTSSEVQEEQPLRYIYRSEDRVRDGYFKV